LLKYLWDHVEEKCVADADGIYYPGSLHALLKDVIPSAQQGEVINRILVPSGAVLRVGQGRWKLMRKRVFEKDDGTPQEMGEAPTVYASHATPIQMLEGKVRALNARVFELEKQVLALTKILINDATPLLEVLSAQPDSETPLHLVEGGDDDVPRMSDAHDLLEPDDPESILDQFFRDPEANPIEGGEHE